VRIGSGSLVAFSRASLMTDSSKERLAEVILSEVGMRIRGGAFAQLGTLDTDVAGGRGEGQVRAVI
jgi:hypothetical protein